MRPAQDQQKEISSRVDALTVVDRELAVVFVLVTVRASTKIPRPESDDSGHETKSIDFDQVDNKTSRCKEQPGTRSTTRRIVVWTRCDKREREMMLEERGKWE